MNKRNKKMAHEKKVDDVRDGTPYLYFSVN
jgi:hypothetical protein